MTNMSEDHQSYKILAKAMDTDEYLLNDEVVETEGLDEKDADKR